MFQTFSNSLRFFGSFLCHHFVQKQKETIEVIIILVAGNLMGFYNPNQLAGHLDVSKTELYRRIKDWSVYQWKKMLLCVGCECALPIKNNCQFSIENIQLKESASRKSVSKIPNYQNIFNKALSGM